MVLEHTRTHAHTHTHSQSFISTYRGLSDGHDEFCLVVVGMGSSPIRSLSHNCAPRRFFTLIRRWTAPKFAMCAPPCRQASKYDRRSSGMFRFSWTLRGAFRRPRFGNAHAILHKQGSNTTAGGASLFRHCICARWVRGSVRGGLVVIYKPRVTFKVLPRTDCHP